MNGDALTYAVATQPSRGSLGTLDPNTGAVLYTPNANAMGTDTFTFTASDGELTSEPAVVTINIGVVNDAPVAQAQSLTVNEDAALTVNLAAMDEDTDSGSLSYVVVDLPAHGTLSGLGANQRVTGGLSYTPNLNFNGTDSFTFKANDGLDDSAIATVNLSVSAVDDAPVVTINSPNEGAKLTTSTRTLVASATDVEDGDVSDSITWTSSLDGTLGNGEDIALSVGEHTLTASVTVVGQNTSVSIAVTVLRTVDSAYVFDQASLDALRGVGKITGSLYIEEYAGASGNLDFSPLNDLKELGGDFRVQLNYYLTDISGFASLESVGGRLLIADNSLTNISGFASLDSASVNSTVEYNYQFDCKANPPTFVPVNSSTLNQVDCDLKP